MPFLCLALDAPIFSACPAPISVYQLTIVVPRNHSCTNPHTASFALLITCNVPEPEPAFLLAQYQQINAQLWTRVCSAHQYFFVLASRILECAAKLTELLSDVAHANTPSSAPHIVHVPLLSSFLAPSVYVPLRPYGKFLAWFSRTQPPALDHSEVEFLFVVVARWLYFRWSYRTSASILGSVRLRMLPWSRWTFHSAPWCIPVLEGTSLPLMCWCPGDTWRQVSWTTP